MTSGVQLLMGMVVEEREILQDYLLGLKWPCGNRQRAMQLGFTGWPPLLP
jgi:hypothetical protein